MNMLLRIRESTWLANGAKNMKEILWTVTTILTPSTMLLSDTLSSIIAQRKRSRNYFSEPQSSRIIFCQQNAARLPVRFWFVPKDLNMLWEKGDPIYWFNLNLIQIPKPSHRNWASSQWDLKICCRRKVHGWRFFASFASQGSLSLMSSRLRCMKTLWLVFLAKVLDYQFTASLFKKKHQVWVAHSGTVNR